MRYSASVTRRELFALPLPLLAAPAKPNILLILADDLGYGDLSCYNPQARTRTPRIDALANQGVQFTDAHSPSSVCTPTRYGLLTGRYCWRTRLKNGVLNGESPSLIEPGRETIASMLKKQGYRTGVFGKWHLGLGNDAKTDYAKELRPSPLDFGFDEFFGIPASLDMPPYVFVDGRRTVELPTSSIETNGAPPRGAFWRGGPIAPGFKMEDVLPKITARARDFVSKKTSEPFFAYVPLNAPHTPWVPTKDRLGKSKAGLYGDFVEQVDAQVGQLLDAVPANTLVIMTSDNGAPWSQPDIEASGGHKADMDWRGQKADIYEAGHRIPLIMRGPGIKRGKSDSLVCLTDLYAAIADAVNHKIGKDDAEDSFSIGKREAIVHHSAQGLFAIRQGGWKLNLGRGSGGFTDPKTITPGPGEPPGELYNLIDDPHETKNLYAEKPEVVGKLKDLLATWQQQGRSRPVTP